MAGMTLQQGFPFFNTGLLVLFRALWHAKTL
jgi:hypothetical protein